MIPFSSWRLKAGSLAIWCRGTFSTHTGGLDGMGWDWVHDTFQSNFTILSRRKQEYLEYLELGQFRNFCNVFIWGLR